MQLNRTTDNMWVGKKGKYAEQPGKEPKKNMTKKRWVD